MKYTKQQWYTPAEVAVHNKYGDCWVILNGKVLDLSGWVEEQFKLCKCLKKCSCRQHIFGCEITCTEKCKCFYNGFKFCDARRLAQTMLAFGGKDVSSWFRGKEWVNHIHPVTTSNTPYYRHGPGIFQPVVPSTLWRPYENPWWLDDSLVIGQATAKTRPIRIVNTATSSSVTLEVCSEETIYQIMMRYLPHNSHMLSYTWRYQGKNLCLSRTLAENGIPDERERFSEVALPENFYIPAILIYYNDDLTEDPPGEDCICPEYSCPRKKDAAKCSGN